MSTPKYHYGHKPAKRRPRKALIVLVCSFTLIGLVVGVIYLDLRRHVSPVAEGESRIVTQALSENANKITIDEPLFTMELPGDWKEIKRNDNNLYTSISWQATKKNKDNRWLTIYIDRIPFDMPVNRLLPVRAQGNTLTFGDLSDNCKTFTGGGTAANTNAQSPAPSRWRDIDFICNLPRSIDNEIGTGSLDSVNSVSVTGPQQDMHKYFFVYTDRNFQPEYSILYDVLQSFRAK